MKICVIGAGTVGTNLARRLSGVGHQVTFGARDPGSPKVTAALAQVDGAAAVPLDQAPGGADLVILAVPFSAIEDVLHTVGDLSGSVLVDATNAFGAALPSGWATIVDVVHRQRPDAVVVKAINTIGAEAYLEPEIDGQALFLPVAGPEPAARMVAEFAGEMGFDAVVVGDGSAAGLLEDFARVWVHLAFRTGLGRGFGFARLHRESSP